MLTRVDLLNRISSSKPNSYLLCNILFQRTLQISAQQSSKAISGAINRAVKEYLNESLEYELSPPKRTQEERVLALR
jgi:hypothetical protein